MIRSLRKPLSRTSLMALAGALALIFIVYAIRASTHLTHGFAMYYTYSRMLVEGVPFERAYAPDEFNARIREYGIEGVQDVPNNLPTTALALLPVAWLPPVEAKVAWSFLSLLFFFLGLHAMFRAYGVGSGDVRRWAILSLALAWRPIYDGIALGQVYFLLFCLFMIAARAIAASYERSAGVSVGLGFLLKGYGAVPAAWFALNGHRKAAVAFVTALVAGVAATLPFLHAASWERFFSGVVLNLGRLPSDAHVAFQTVNGLLFHLFTYDPVWIPRPLTVLPRSLVVAASYSINLALAILVLARSGRGSRQNPVLGLSAAIAAGVITAPLAEEYHYILFLPLVSGLILELWDRWDAMPGWTVSRFVFVAFVIVLAAPLGYKNLQDSGFPLILLAYPKLFAGLGLLLYSVKTDWLTAGMSKGSPAHDTLHF